VRGTGRDNIPEAEGSVHSSAVPTVPTSSGAFDHESNFGHEEMQDPSGDSELGSFHSELLSLRDRAAH
jgi:hypothetical protein